MIRKRRHRGMSLSGVLKSLGVIIQPVFHCWWSDRGWTAKVVKTYFKYVNVIGQDIVPKSLNSLKVSENRR